MKTGQKSQEALTPEDISIADTTIRTALMNLQSQLCSSCGQQIWSGWMGISRNKIASLQFFTSVEQVINKCKWSVMMARDELYFKSTVSGGPRQYIRNIPCVVWCSRSLSPGELYCLRSGAAPHTTTCYIHYTSCRARLFIFWHFLVSFPLSVNGLQ